MVLGLNGQIKLKCVEDRQADSHWLQRAADNKFGSVGFFVWLMTTVKMVSNNRWAAAASTPPPLPLPCQRRLLDTVATTQRDGQWSRTPPSPSLVRLTIDLRAGWSNWTNVRCLSAATGCKAIATPARFLRLRRERDTCCFFPPSRQSLLDSVSLRQSRIKPPQT